MFFLDTDAINLLFLGFNFIWVMVNTKKTREIEASQKYAPQLIDEIFKPCYENIECNLFISITENNKDKILSNLIDLYLQLKKEKLLFYISDSLLISLEAIIKEGSKQSDDLKQFNQLYQCFSRDYYYELNRFRKIVGLKRRSINFRIYHKLYKYHIQWLFMKHLYLLPVFFFLIYYLVRLYNLLVK